MSDQLELPAALEPGRWISPVLPSTGGLAGLVRAANPEVWCSLVLRSRGFHRTKPTVDHVQVIRDTPATCHTVSLVHYAWGLQAWALFLNGKVASDHVWTRHPADPAPVRTGVTLLAALVRDPITRHWPRWTRPDLGDDDR